MIWLEGGLKYRGKTLDVFHLKKGEGRRNSKKRLFIFPEESHQFFRWGGSKSSFTKRGGKSFKLHC